MWKSVNFSECLVKTKTLFKLQKSEYKATGLYPIVSQEASLISGYHDEIDHVFRVEKPVIVFGDHTQVLKYVDFDFVVGADGVKILLTKDEIDTKYFFYALKLLMPQAKGYARHYKLLTDLSMPLPPLAEQQRIVEKLDRAFEEIDRAIEATKLRVIEFDNLMIKTLSQFITAKDFPRYMIDDVCKVGDGNHSSNYPKAEEMVDEGVAFLRSGNIQNGTITSDDLKFISKEKHERLKKGHLKAGDVVITNRGDIGKTAIVPMAFDGANLNSQIAWLRPNSELDSEYLYFCLNTKQAKNEFASQKTGTALQQFTIKQLKAFMIPIPSLKVQRDIVISLRDHTECVLRIQSISTDKLQNLSLLKSAILTQELKGPE
jgi:type I restriction enzyme S subunit